MPTVHTQLKVLQAIQSEREYQEQTWPLHRHSVAEWLLIMEHCLLDAKRAWYKGGDEKALHQIRQITACGVAAMEQCGAPLRELRNKEPLMETPVSNG